MFRIYSICLKHANDIQVFGRISAFKYAQYKVYVVSIMLKQVLDNFTQ